MHFDCVQQQFGAPMLKSARLMLHLIKWKAI